MADTETSTNATITPERLQAKYDDLRLHFERLASALGTLSRSIETDDPGVASDVCKIFENYACEVLNEHPRSGSEILFE